MRFFAKFIEKDFREVEEVGEYNKFAEGGLWIKFNGEDKILHCELIDEDSYATIHDAFCEFIKNEDAASKDDEVWDRIYIAEAAGIVKIR